MPIIEIEIPPLLKQVYPLQIETSSLKLDLPMDVFKLLQDQAIIAGEELRAYTGRFFRLMLVTLLERPDARSYEAKLGWDLMELTVVLFPKFVRQAANVMPIILQLSTQPQAELSPEEWDREFVRWVESHDHLPALPAASFSRESFYEDRD